MRSAWFPHGRRRSSRWNHGGERLSPPRVHFVCSPEFRPPTKLMDRVVNMSEGKASDFFVRAQPEHGCIMAAACPVFGCSIGVALRNQPSNHRIEEFVVCKGDPTFCGGQLFSDLKVATKKRVFLDPRRYKPSKADIAIPNPIKTPK